MSYQRLIAFRAAAVFAVAMLASGCGGTPIDVPPPDATPTDDVPIVTDVTTPDGGAQCLSTRDCASGEECVYASSMCARSGACMPRIECFRAETYCSCTGESYEGCRPDRPTQSAGACPSVDGGVDVPPTDAGPGACRSNADCDRSQWCSGSGCGTPGTCAARPSVCPDLYSPVCGCDGRTYGNECEAAAAGARFASRGACPSVDGGVDVPPIDAGPGACVTASDCGRGQECVYPSALCARSGTCSPAVECLRPETFCSCTGETYLGCRPDRPTRSTGACPAPDAGVDAGSFCAAALCGPGTVCCEAARACIPMGALCVAPSDACRTNADCASGSYCAGTSCGTAGTCATRPTVCTREYNPVCGCDGLTYGNACTAAAAGVRVASSGACR